MPNAADRNEYVGLSNEFKVFPTHNLGTKVDKFPWRKRAASIRPSDAWQVSMPHTSFWEPVPEPLPKRNYTQAVGIDQARELWLPLSIPLDTMDSEVLIILLDDRCSMELTVPV